ncbi:ABC transporter permease [Nocardia sp. NPDC051030]|uniref:ABC transporter permease n=1 Tax=Nocardia sp. NPDC051030 TaxID=3155162 RepID=UPI00343668C9
MIVTVPPVVARAANSEVRKATSVRVNWALAGGVFGVGVLAFLALGLTFEPGASKKDGFVFASGWGAAVVGWALVLTVASAGVFGALASGWEYGFRSLAVSSVFTPDRNLLLGAKLGVVAAFSLATVLAMELVGGAAMLLIGRDKVPVTAGLFAVLGGVALAATCWAVIGASLGFLLRSPIQAVGVVLGLAILEPLVWITARAIGFAGLGTILPVSATVSAISGGKFADTAFLAPPPAATAVLVLWTAAAVAGAWWFVNQRDI